MRHAPPAKARITDRGVADAIAKPATKYTGPLSVVVEERQQAPPRLYDRPSIQKACGQWWGRGADTAATHVGTSKCHWNDLVSA